MITDNTLMNSCELWQLVRVYSGMLQEVQCIDLRKLCSVVGKRLKGRMIPTRMHHMVDDQ